MIYFVRAGASGPVKIGFARDVASRLYTLQTGHYEELSLLRAIEGDEPQERWLHRRFGHLRMRGEWFTFASEMLTVTPPELVHGAARSRGFQERKERAGGFAEIIRLWPNRADFARAINVPYVTAQQMELRNSISSKHWDSIVLEAQRIGHPEVTHQRLLAAYREARAA